MLVYYRFLLIKNLSQTKERKSSRCAIWRPMWLKPEKQKLTTDGRCAIEMRNVQLCIWHGGEYLKKDVLHFLKKSWVFAKSIWETWAILVKKSSKVVGGFHLKGSGLSDNDHLALRKASLWNVFSEVHAAWTIPIHYSSSPMDAN